MTILILKLLTYLGVAIDLFRGTRGLRNQVADLIRDVATEKSAKDRAETLLGEAQDWAANRGRDASHYKARTEALERIHATSTRVGVVHLDLDAIEQALVGIHSGLRIREDATKCVVYLDHQVEDTAPELTRDQLDQVRALLRFHLEEG